MFMGLATPWVALNHHSMVARPFLVNVRDLISPTQSGTESRLIGALALTGLLILAAAGIAAATGPVGTAAGFEDDDGNLIVDSTFDWNSFATATWNGTAPTRTSGTTVSGWTFRGLEDWQATTSDSAFAGGTKQDDACPTVITQKADNKADLKRIYLASKTGGNGHTYLMLSWVRIPQNTTSPSAHVAFEFNQGTTPCPAGSDGLVQRSEGDMLIVYDFEGGTTDNPSIGLSLWVTDPAAVCQIGSHSPPCWGTQATLTSGQAEAKVNTFGAVSDGIAPNPPETLGTNEFGEAGIDLTNAGVFPLGTCRTFGTAFGVSRTSGNSGTAQMKDLVGPANFSLTNCGQIKIVKRTNPRGVNQAFGFTSTIPASATCTADTTPASFSLNDNGNTSSDSAGNTENCTNVPAGGPYTITEDNDPTGFAFSSLTCTTTGAGTSASTSGKVASATIAGGGVVTCVYTNQQQLGAIKITKTSTKGNAALAGASFSIKQGGIGITGSPFTADSNGVVCVDNLSYGNYDVKEESAPTGYKIDDTTTSTITVDNNAKCSDSTFVGETKAYSDTPLSKIQIIFTPLAGADVTKAQIVCVTSGSTVSPVSENGDPDSTSPATYDDTDESFTNLAPGVYTCVIDVDP
jgi:hypothetical protein